MDWGHNISSHTFLQHRVSLSSRDECFIRERMDKPNSRHSHFSGNGVSRGVWNEYLTSWLSVPCSEHGTRLCELCFVARCTCSSLIKRDQRYSREGKKRVLEWRIVYCLRIRSRIGRFYCIMALMWHGTDVTWVFFSSPLCMVLKMGHLTVSAGGADPACLARQNAF